MSRSTACLVAASVLLVVGRASSDDSTAVPRHAPPPVVSDKHIEALLAPIREKHKVPGLVAGIVTSRGLQSAGAVGLRKAGSPEAITVHDQLHIGSDTKAMTATLLGQLVDEGKLSWQSTVGDVFPHLKAEVHPDFVHVTLEQLLTHRAGLPANLPYGQFADVSVVAQRQALLKKALAEAPLDAPGTKFSYSNVGYIIAGHFAEQITGRSWEELMRSELFEPLGMSSAGFGPPGMKDSGTKGTGTKDAVDQPWGHQLIFGKAQALQLDNPEVLGPAGRVHCSIADWALFVALHLQGARNETKFLKPETFKTLHTPPAGQEYAAGWGLVERPWAGGRALMHAGSNTMWYAVAWLAPERDVAYLAVVNQGGDAAREACDAAVAALILEWQKPPADAAAAADKPAVQKLTTPGGVRFAILGSKPSAPAPTLFVFAHEMAGTLDSDAYNKVGRFLQARQFLCVSLDLPCHGQAVRADEPQGLDGWEARLRKDEDPIGPFVKEAAQVLDYLIAEGYTDAQQVAACGTSRGGFAALHFAAAEPRVRCVAAFAPVTELPALREFQGLEQHARTNELAIARQAEKLSGRPVWICIGNDDERVGTDRAIAFARQVVQASKSQKKNAMIELHVMASTGHSVHPTAHAEAAAWIAERMKTAAK